MISRKKPGVAFWATVALVVVPLLYVGAYFAMVRPVGQECFGGIRYVPCAYWGPFGEEVSGKMRDDLIWFFQPALRADRRIRPAVWPPWKDLTPWNKGPRM